MKKSPFLTPGKEIPKDEAIKIGNRMGVSIEAIHLKASDSLVDEGNSAGLQKKLKMVWREVGAVDSSGKISLG